MSSIARTVAEFHAAAFPDARIYVAVGDGPDEALIVTDDQVISVDEHGNTSSTYAMWGTGYEC